MKPWIPALLISATFTGFGFILLFRAETVDVGFLYCFGSFVVGNILAHKAYDRLKARED